MKLKIQIGAEAIVNGVRHIRLTKVTRTLLVDDPFLMALLEALPTHRGKHAEPLPDSKSVDLALATVPDCLKAEVAGAKLELLPGEESFFIRLSKVGGGKPKSVSC